MSEAAERYWKDKPGTKEQWSAVFKAKQSLEYSLLEIYPDAAGLKVSLYNNCGETEFISVANLGKPCCSNCSKPHELCECWEPDGELGHSEEYVTTFRQIAT